PRHERPLAGQAAPLPRHAGSQLGAARAGHAGGALVRLAVLRAGLGLGRLPQPQHVHPHRPRRGGRVPLQSGRHSDPVALPGGVSDRPGGGSGVPRPRGFQGVFGWWFTLGPSPPLGGSKTSQRPAATTPAGSSSGGTASPPGRLPASPSERSAPPAA